LEGVFRNRAERSRAFRAWTSVDEENGRLSFEWKDYADGDKTKIMTPDAVVFIRRSISVFTRQWDRTVGQLRAAIDLGATYWPDPVFLDRAYKQKHDLPDAIAAFEQALKLNPDHSEIWSSLGHAYGISGNTREARKVLAKLQTPGALSSIASYNVAIVYAGLGDTSQPFVWLERAFEQRSNYLPTHFPPDERLDNLTGSPHGESLETR
jgi:tetratricopeptide (TPR) repeat protein